MLARKQLLDLYGPENPQKRILEINQISPRLLKEWYQAKNVLDKRCVVCHSCYDAPCQLKLTSMHGIDRGASKNLVYDGTRLSAIAPTRLFVDAKDTAHWRTKGFAPVLNERSQLPEANLKASVMYRLLNLKYENPLPSIPVLPSNLLPNSFDFSIDRSQFCPSIDELDYYEKVYPLWGMPFGFPGLSDIELGVLKSWLQHGAYAPAPEPISEKLKVEIANWESFLNASSMKEQLMARYLYEHLFSADVSFDDVDKDRIFKLVRSSASPDRDIEIIKTRRPTDDPKVERVYYRFMLNEETVVEKTHMPYVLNKKRMDRYKDLFLKPDYDIKEFPSYLPELATNPFATFKDIPLVSRYRFLLDEAQYFIMGFIKGPVCRGQVALNVIEDRFWVLFIDPEKEPLIRDREFLSEQTKHLRLPAEAGSDPSLIVNWLRYSKEQKKYLSAKRNYLRKLADGGYRPTLDKIWFGDKKNTNAALTVFRHYDSATVVRGLVGRMPKNAWIMDYSLFERMHYLLAADFDVFGSVGHQLLTRLYMDFLRAEGENNFLIFLPKAIREREHDFWYRGLGANTNKYALSTDNFDWTESGIRYKSDKPKVEFFDLVKKELGGALDREYESLPLDLSYEGNGALERISNLNGVAASFLPEMSLIRLMRKGMPDRIYTLLLNRAHKNVAILYLENFRLIPEEDDTTLVSGFIGAYPNSFFVVDEEGLDLFSKKLEALRSEKDYRELLDIFGVRRTNLEFWHYSDWFQDAYLKSKMGDRGVLDYSRFENR